MAAGLAVTVYYIGANTPWFRTTFGLAGPGPQWFGIVPVCAGVFGVAIGAIVCAAVSLATQAGVAVPAPRALEP